MKVYSKLYLPFSFENICSNHFCEGGEEDAYLQPKLAGIITTGAAVLQD